MENAKGINSKTINLEETINIEGNISPFGLYEDMYCSKCQDYRGCIGLIDSTSMALQDSNMITGDKGFDNVIKSMGGLTFSTRFRAILDCARLRNIVSKMTDDN